MSKLFYYSYFIYSVRQKITLLLTWCKEGARRRNRTRLGRRRAAVRREEGGDCGGITSKPGSITTAISGKPGEAVCCVPGASADAPLLLADEVPAAGGRVGLRSFSSRSVAGSRFKSRCCVMCDLRLKST